ncbi:hypothetical protein FB561_6751 [Kribbella amoyensis]|uniref:Carboxypeptidase family protein n=1 Tax=Kribbella amoyensis TaxID=996641 RepID=A0A561B8X6_9ACTN|nr:hypothetical protein [Kribbella amoyensis]TWD75313.1 hypothetical protein FB561_6751 [Kribbella amoyensis]
MLKRSIAVAGVAALLGGVGSQTAVADSRSVTAISAVQVSWADPEHTNLKITWTEDSPAANTVALVTDSGPPTELGTVPADAGNSFIIDSASLGNTANRASKSWIVVGDSATPAVQARSVDFDRYLYQPASVTASFTADNQVRWTVPPDTSVDGTPNDPLDLPAGQDRYLPIRRTDPDPAAASVDCETEDLPVAAGPTGLATSNGKPSVLSVNPDNEWGARLGPSVDVTVTTGITISAPASTQYGSNTTITGQVTGRGLPIGGSPPACDEVTSPVQNQPVVLQQRTSSTAAWTVVGTTKTDATGKYTAVVKNPGYREYRVLRSNTAGVGFAAYGGAPSDSTAVRSTTVVVSAKFITPTITSGTQPQAYLWVDPAGTQQAALQFKNAGGAWQGLSYKTLYAGRGLLPFTWNTRGTFQFRWWVPAYGGADATYSPVFTLTVK